MFRSYCRYPLLANLQLPLKTNGQAQIPGDMLATRPTFETIYSRMDQVKFVGDILYKYL